MKKILAAYLCLLLILPNQSASASKEFEKDIKAVLVEAKAQAYDKDSSSPLEVMILGYSKNFMGVDLQFPSSEKKIRQWVVNILEEEIRTPDKIEVSLLSDKNLGLYTDNTYKDSISVLFDFKYFPSKSFTPSLNAGIISITTKKKRLVSINMGIDGFKEVKIERDYGPFLLSVPENEQELEVRIKEYIRYISKKLLTEKINCANGGACSK